MKQSIAFLISLFCSSFLFAQQPMRPLEQLINQTESGWPLVREWIAKAMNSVEILPVDTARAKEALFQTQVTTRSPMGAIVYASGGLLIDSGWIRILGSGHTRLNRTLPGWNKGKTFKSFGEAPTYLLVADDASGGFFALNGGGLGTDHGKLYYLAPDNLRWEPLGLTYSEFLHFCFNGDLTAFYKRMRWRGWLAEVNKLDGNAVYSFFPYLWAKEADDINKISRKTVSVEEQFNFSLNMRRQLGLVKERR